MVKRGDMLAADDVVDLLAIECIGIVPEDPNVLVSSNQGVPVVLNEKTKVGKAFRNIALRIKGEQVPFLDLDEKDNFFGRLGKVFRGANH